MNIISIIIPVYNVGKFLNKCLESIKEQTFKNFEVIIINDASTDNSLEIINKFINLDNRFKLITLEKNKGLFNARREGFKQANGDYIMTIDGDDFIPLKALEILYDKAETYDVDMVESRFLHVNKTNTWARDYHCTYAENPKYIPNKIFQQKELFDTNRGFFIWSKLFKRCVFTKDVFKEMDLVTEHLILHEDILFSYIILPRVKSYYYTPERLYYYIQQENSSLNNYSFKSIEKKLYDDVLVKKYLHAVYTNRGNENTTIEINTLMNQYIFWLYSDTINQNVKDSDKINTLFDPYLDKIKQASNTINAIKNLMFKLRACLSQSPLLKHNSFRRDFARETYYLLKDIIKHGKFQNIFYYCKSIYNIGQKHLLKSLNKFDVNQCNFEIKNYKVSIGVSCYNVGEFIEDAINSILHQTHSNMEIILVNDCSTDNTLEILKKYEQLDNRIKIIEHPYNKSLIQTRYSFLQNSTGEYILFIDGDDILENNAIEYLLKHMIFHQADMVKGNFYWLEDNIKYTHLEYPGSSYFNMLSEPITSKKKYPYRDLLINDYPHNVWGNLYKRNIFNPKVMKVLSECGYINMSEDLLISYLISKNIGSFTSIKDAIYGYRQINTSMMRNISLNSCIKNIENLSMTFNLIQDKHLNSIKTSLMSHKIINTIVYAFNIQFYNLDRCDVQEYLNSFIQNLEKYYMDSDDYRITILKQEITNNIKSLN